MFSNIFKKKKFINHMYLAKEGVWLDGVQNLKQELIDQNVSNSLYKEAFNTCKDQFSLEELSLLLSGIGEYISPYNEIKSDLIKTEIENRLKER